MKKLTEAQRDFAEQHHGLVTQYLRKKGLREDDYYDIVVFGYLRAVQAYDERPELRQYSFRSVAYRRMFATLWNHFRSLRAAKRNATVLSLHAPARDGLALAEHIAAGAPAVHEYAESRDAWESARAAATPKQAEVLALRAKGYTGREIGRVYRLSPSAVYGRVYRLRKNTARLAA
jgi:RNA polymerase sigma-70 factor (ECF subfamily)